MKIIDILNKKANETLEDGFKFCFRDEVFTYDKKLDRIHKGNKIFNKQLGEAYQLEACLNDEILLFQEETKELEKREENEKDEKILNNLINKKEEILEFKEIKAIVKLLLNVDKKLERLMPKEIYMKMKMEESEEK